MNKTYSMHPAVTGAITGTDTTVNALNLDMAKPFVEQVTTFLKKAGDISGYGSFMLPGQGVAAILSLPVLEMSVGFPTTPVYDVAKKAVVGELALGNYRHEVVRPERAKLTSGEAYAGYTVIDGAGRGMTPVQLDELKKLIGSEDIRVLAAPLGQLDFTDPTKGVVETLLATGINFETLTSGRVLYLPAGMGLGAVVQATAIYGLSEAWPKVIRLNRNADGSFGVAEICDPQALRQFGVQLAAGWREAVAPVAVPRELFDRVVGLLRLNGGDGAADEMEALATSK